MPTPGTASKSESLLGQVLAILRNVRSPKMRKAGIFLRLASVNRHARKACSRRAWRSGGAAGEAAVEAVKAGGASDYIRKNPGLVDEIKLAINRALEKLVLSKQNFALRRDAAERDFR